MWELKFDSSYSLFFEWSEKTSYFRNEYDVFINNELVYEKQNTNTFSVYRSITGVVNIRVVSSDRIEFDQDIDMNDKNYYLNVKDYLVSSDYERDVTSKLQALILSLPDYTTVFFPKAVYKITSLILKSNLKLIFEDGAILEASVDRFDYPIIPSIVEPKDFSRERCISTWEGNPQQTFSSILSGYNIENVEIIGKVKLKGNANFDNWWNDCKVKNTAWRPKSVFFNNCKNITVHGLEIYDSPSWSVHPFYCQDMKFLDLFISNPRISPNTDGINPESCRDLEINGCHFNLGDDCIAIKSGKIYMASTHYQPTSGIKIVNCKMEHGHGAIVLGSEIACGVKDLYIENCFFNNTDRGLRVKTRRGRGEKSIIDNIKFQNIVMDKVKTPITLNSYYSCDPDGNSDYVASKEAIGRKVDMPTLGSFYFDNLECIDITHAICVAYGLPENYIEKIVISNSKFSFLKTDEIGAPLMMRDALRINQELINLLNIENFELNNNEFINIKSDNKTLVNINEMKETSNEYS